MKELYTVGEISQLFKVSKDTLRYYDRIGLLSPWQTGTNNYRYYSKAQFEMISSILLLRNIGTPIAKLKKMLHYTDTSLIETELASYKNAIDKRIEKLEYMKEQVSQVCSNIHDTCYDEDVSLKTCPDMYALVKEYNSTTDELDIEMIKNVNHSALSNWISFANIISTSSKEDLLRGEYHTYRTYGYLSETKCDMAPKRLLRVFKGGTYVCCNARIERIDHLDIDRIYDKMLQFISDNGYIINGDSIERNVLDLYGNTSASLTIFFKIYIPVTCCADNSL